MQDRRSGMHGRHRRKEQSGTARVGICKFFWCLLGQMYNNTLRDVRCTTRIITSSIRRTPTTPDFGYSNLPIQISFSTQISFAYPVTLLALNHVN
jgi:hypothetical protein